MNAERRSETTSQRTSDRELTVTRTFDAPPHLVFQAWTQAELFSQWWLPKSFGLTLQSCEMSARVGGHYKLVIVPPGGAPMDFFGRYLDVVPNQRLKWTNEENGEAGAITTVTFDEQGGKTFVVMKDLYPSKAALDACIDNGSTSGTCDTFDQLATFLGSA